jgi:threonine dehydratase
MAKNHIRHMVGGHAPQVCEKGNELLYRFEFPERPGALMNFLTQMSAGWNISLFHYRNHGADYGPRAGRHAGAAGEMPESGVRLRVIQAS